MDANFITDLTLKIDKKNRALRKIKNKLSVTKGIDETTLENLLKLIDYSLSDVKSEDEVVAYFETVNPNFTARLQEKFTDLTKLELRHCIYIRNGLNRKQISDQMGITMNGVRNARNRMRRKMNIDLPETLDEFIEKI